mgnify:CR=1 FL=1
MDGNLCLHAGSEKSIADPGNGTVTLFWICCDLDTSMHRSHSEHSRAVILIRPETCLKASIPFVVADLSRRPYVKVQVT